MRWRVKGVVFQTCGLSRRRLRAASAVLLAASAMGTLLSACASEAEREEPREYLDESTAATVTVVRTPLVFARERSDLAANARDYVTLAAAAVNSAGRVHYILVTYRWSTIDVRLDPDRPRPTDPLVVAADDRRIQLTAPTHSPHDAGIDTPVHPPPGPRREPAVYTIDLATLRFIAAARRLVVRTGASDTAPTYEIWTDGRRALNDFVDRMQGPR